MPYGQQNTCEQVRRSAHGDVRLTAHQTRPVVGKLFDDRATLDHTIWHRAKSGANGMGCVCKWI